MQLISAPFGQHISGNTSQATHQTAVRSTQGGVFISVLHTQLSNGLIVLGEVLPNPSVSFALRVPCGAADDLVLGSSSALEEWLHKGAAGKDAQALAAAWDDLGVQFNSHTGLQYSRFSGSCLPDTFSDALSLLSQLLLSPHLADDELAPILDLARQDLESLADNPSDWLFVELNRRFFASQHGQTVQGTLDTLAQLTPEVVRSAYSRYTPQGSILSIAGQFDWAATIGHLEQIFASWQGQPVAFSPVITRPAFREHIEMPSHQSHIAWMYNGLYPTDPQWYSYNLALGVLSGGSGARLFREVREKRGLVYNVNANADLRGNRGFVSVYAGTTVERVAETVAVIEAQLAGMQAGVTAAELERIKVGYLSQLIMSGESARARCGALGRDFVMLGRVRSLEEITQAVESVSWADINQFLANWRWNTPSVLSVGLTTRHAPQTGGMHV